MTVAILMCPEEECGGSAGDWDGKQNRFLGVTATCIYLHMCMTDVCLNSG